MLFKISIADRKVPIEQHVLGISGLLSIAVWYRNSNNEQERLCLETAI